MADRLNLNEFEQILLAVRRQIVGDSRQMRTDAHMSGTDGGEECPHAPQHLADAASDMYEQEFTLERLSLSSATLQAVDEALDRIENGTYGQCEECEVEVPQRRLRLKPWAALCIECQKAQEAEG